MTSDTFFSSPDKIAEIRQPIDFAFLDGLHTFEFLLRDFYNTERLCGHGSLIAMHDCLPLNADMSARDFGSVAERGTNTAYPYWWTGDVWKIIPILRKYRPDVRIVYVDCPPTGLVFVTNLDPQSTVLQSNYIRIVSEFAQLPNTDASLTALFAEVEITKSQNILKDFDHTLYFKM